MSWWLWAFLGSAARWRNADALAGFICCSSVSGAAGRRTGRPGRHQSAWMSWLLFQVFQSAPAGTYAPTPATHGDRPGRDLASRYDGRERHRLEDIPPDGRGKSGMPRQHVECA